MLRSARRILTDPAQRRTNLLSHVAPFLGDVHTRGDETRGIQEKGRLLAITDYLGE